jgi:hypothetical protein
MDRTYCKTIFDFDTYTILATTRLYRGGQFRYHSNGTDICGVKYYTCNNWLERHRTALLDWLWANKI